VGTTPPAAPILTLDGLFRDTMLKLIHSDNLEYKELRRAA
jgi:hypothetical protein